MTTIGFTGHRNRTVDPARLHALAAEFPGATWVHGNADGFDTQVRYFIQRFGEQYGLTPVKLLPRYDLYPPQEAPLVRDREIVDQADFLVACWDGREVGGTYYTRNYAKANQKEVRDWPVYHDIADVI